MVAEIVSLSSDSAALAARRSVDRSRRSAEAAAENAPMPRAEPFSVWAIAAMSAGKVDIRATRSADCRTNRVSTSRCKAVVAERHPRQVSGIDKPLIGNEWRRRHPRDPVVNGRIERHRGKSPRMVDLVFSGEPAHGSMGLVNESLTQGLAARGLARPQPARRHLSATKLPRSKMPRMRVRYGLRELTMIKMLLTATVSFGATSQ